MLAFTINGHLTKASAGTSILEAAKALGIEIPNLCSYHGLEHFNSCMICLVKDINTNALIPACSAKVAKGMQIITSDNDIIEARKTALELMLSDHVGDCEAPCRRACPAFMNIPLMNRHIAAGEINKALEIVVKDIALPSVLGRICQAPCEAACKRKDIDEAVAICLLKRFCADYSQLPIPDFKPLASEPKVAIIGAGPAGLSAAFYLQLKGIQAHVFDKNEKAGGALRYAIPDNRLEKEVLDKDIALIEKSGVVINTNFNFGHDEFVKFQKLYNAIILATGNYSDDIGKLGVANKGNQVIVDKQSFQTNIHKVFAIGNLNRESNMAIRSCAQGKDVAFVVEQLIVNDEIADKPKRFNCITGKLMPEEFAEYLKEGSAEKRQLPEENHNKAYVENVARKEAERCLHCDCRKNDACKLRDYATLYQAERKRFAYHERKPVKKIAEHSLLMYEPEKCIKCALCVRLSAEHPNEIGLTFISRGYNVEIGTPFNININEALKKTADIVCQACPTGALAIKHKPNTI